MLTQLRNANLVPPIRLVFVMWLAYTIQSSLGKDLGFLGIYPRTYSGMIGILTAPLIHGNLSHLISNTIGIKIVEVTELSKLDNA